MKSSITFSSLLPSTYRSTSRALLSRRRAQLLLLSLMISGAGLWAGTNQARMATLQTNISINCVATTVVTSTNDSGAGSLRDAIINACPGNTITFNIPTSDPNYSAATNVFTIELNSELVINKNLTITGPGANLLTISGGDASRVFFINPGAAGAVNPPAAPFPVVHLSHLRIANGKAQGGNGGKGLQRAAGGGGGAGMGGGIFINGATVTIDHVAFDHNQALGGNGGHTADFGGFAGGGGGGGTAGNGSDTGNGTGNVLIGGNGGGGGSFGGNGGPGGPEYGSGANGGEGSGGGGNGGNFSGSFAGNQSFAPGNAGFGGGGAGGAKRRVPDGASAGGGGGFGGGGGGGINGLAPGGGGSFGGAGGGGGPQGGSGGGGAGLGGAVFIRAGNLVLQNSTFSSNSTTAGNGGTPCCAPAGTRGQGKGGGIFIHTSATASATSITFDSNTAPDAAGTPIDNHDIYGLLQLPPVANDQSVTVPEDTGTAITLGATDPNASDQLTYSILSVPTHGALTGSGNSFTYTPGLNYNGPDSFTFTANDGAFESNTATVSIAVNAVNDAPSFVSGPNQTSAEDSGAQIVASWGTAISPGPADESGQTLAFVIQSNSNPGLLAAGPAISSTGTLSYTPAANANGSTTITIALMDNGGGTNTSTSHTFVTTVTAVNDAPNAADDSIAGMAEDSGLRTIPISSLLGNDSAGANESGQTLTLTSVGSAVGGTVSSDATNVYFSPGAGFNGAASFLYTTTDNGTSGSPAAADPKTATASVSFDITPVNDAPAAGADGLTKVAEDSGIRTIPISSLLGNDTAGSNESGQTLTLTSVGSAVGGTVSSDATNVYFTPAADFNGSASFQYTITDNGTSGSPAVADPKTASGSVSFTVTEINDAPTANSETIASVAEDSSQRTIPFATLTANEVKGPANESSQTLVVKTVSNPVGGTVSLLGGNVIFTPTADYFGAASFQYTVEDNGTTHGMVAPLTSGMATASFNITEVNDAPDATDDALSSQAEDSGVRTIAIASLLGNDGKGPANESSQTLSFSLVGGSEVGGIVSNDATNVYFTPTAAYNGPASFLYTATDNGTTSGLPDSKSDTATVSFVITEVNDAPAAVSDVIANVAEDSGPATIPFATLTTNDSKGAANESGQTLIVRTVGNPVGGTVTILGSNVLFTPTANYNGPAGFDYTVEDNGTSNGVVDPLTSGTATASFTVTEVNDAPTAANDPLGTVAENSGERTIPFSTLLSNDMKGPANESGQILTVKTVSNPVGGTVSIVAGTVRFTVASNHTGLTTFQYTVEDNGTSNGLADPKTSAPATAHFNVTANSPGVVIRFSAANYSVAESEGFSTITVERTGDTSQAVTVDYASSDHSNPADFMPCTWPGAGLASSRCDFTTVVGTLRFAPGETSTTFKVMVSQDNYVESPETLDLTLSNPTGGAVLGTPSTAFLEITDDAIEGTTNPIDQARDFVSQQYRDMLRREPDASGLAFWTDNIEKCNDPARRPAGQTVEQCTDKQRESTAIAFFMSPELQMTAGFVYRLYKGSLTGLPNFDGGSPTSSPGRFPTFVEFMRDVSQISDGIVVGNQISGAVVEANRNRLAAEFVERPEFVAKYGGLNDTLYVEELFNTTGISQEQFNSTFESSLAGEKQALVDGLSNGTETRASVLRKVVDGTVVIGESNVRFTTGYGQAFYNQEYRRVFVFMEYVAYLRRNPDQAGFIFWLGKLNQFNGDPFQAEMVRSFILSPEYRSRFGQP